MPFRNDLIQFCASNLSPAFDPVRYADGLIAKDGDEAFFEIRGLHTKTGAPVTVRYEVIA